jgi:hypothetical protein
MNYNPGYSGVFIFRKGQVGAMAGEEKSEGSIWDKISRIRSTECVACGHANPENIRLCEKCGKKLPLDDDELATNAVSGEIRRPGKSTKIPLEDAKTLNVLRDICERIQSGSISRDEFTRTHQKIQHISSTGLALWDTEAGKHLLGKLTGEELELAHRQHQEFRNFNEGVERIGSFLRTENMKDVVEGFRKAEKAMIELDRIQDRQNEIVDAQS